jgi:hypothetical protein
VQALQALGAKHDLSGCFRCSHAFIAQVGQDDSQVVEAADPLRPVGVATDLGLTEPNLAALVEWIRLESIN